MALEKASLFGVRSSLGMNFRSIQRMPAALAVAWRRT